MRTLGIQERGEAAAYDGSAPARAQDRAERRPPHDLRPAQIRARRRPRGLHQPRRQDAVHPPPSLSAAIQELEAELGVTLFRRTSTGVVTTTDGEKFLGYARQVIEQADLIVERYFGSAPVKRQFCVSCQHYSFAVEAFVALIKKHGGREHDFRIRETQTYEIIEDVAALRSEIGVLYLNDFNRSVIACTLEDNALRFTRLFIASPHVFVGTDSRLAGRASVTLADRTVSAPVLRAG